MRVLEVPNRLGLAYAGRATDQADMLAGVLVDRPKRPQQLCCRFGYDESPGTGLAGPGLISFKSSAMAAFFCMSGFARGG